MQKKLTVWKSCLKKTAAGAEKRKISYRCAAMIRVCTQRKVGGTYVDAVYYVDYLQDFSQ